MINMSSEDINRTYQGTYLGYRTEEGIASCYVDHASGNNMFMAELHGYGLEGHRELSINDPCLVLTFPDSGAYNVGSRGVYIERKEERQWHRGIRRQALNLSDSNVGVNHELVLAMYNPKYSTLSHAIEACSERGARAISKLFWLNKNNNHVNIPIMFRSTCIGEIIDGEVTIPNKIIKQAFEEAVSAHR